MRLYAAAVVALALAACGAESEQVRGPDGSMNWYAVSCRRDPANCYEEAGDLCPHGYVTVDQGSEQGAAVSRFGDSAIITPTFHGHMLIKCKGKHRSADDE
jgi:hypothetical protein